MRGRSPRLAHFNRESFVFGTLFLAASCFPGLAHAYGLPQAGRTGTVDDSRTLQDARGAFRARNLLLAREKADKIKGVSGPIGEEAQQILKMVDDVQSINRKMDRVRAALYKNDSTAACTVLSEIQDVIEKGTPDFKRFYGDLNIYNEKQKAGGCIPQPPTPPAPVVDQLKVDYDRAVRFRENERHQEALNILNRIHGVSPGYKDVEQQISDIREELKANQKKSQDQLFTDALNSTRKALEKGNLITARDLLKKAESIRAADPAVKDLGEQVRKGIEQDERELQEAIAAFYQGKYLQAQKGFENFLQRGHSPRVAAFACFYSGAARVSEFYLTGAKDPQKKEAAARDFQRSIREDPEFAPQWETVSPRIRALYQEVGKKPQ